jgi:DNA mismatch endonuclease (patch repair protein)
MVREEDRGRDPLTPEQRSLRMSQAGKPGNKLEQKVREVVSELGYQFETNIADLPGKPDLVFPERRKVIFVHGCFGHGHEKCPRAIPPASRREFWLPKLVANRERDQRDQVALSEQGWDVLVIWEDELKLRDRPALIAKITNFLG